MRLKSYQKVLIYFFFCLFFFFFPCVKAAEKKEGIENFPDSYKPYLYELKKKYPHWVFTALYTGLDWNTVINNEYANDKNLVPLNYSDDWKCKENGKYNVEIDKRLGKCFKKSSRIYNGS